ncbi:hypothetical protein QQF64_004230 [Cirrhinus molitorella]
MCSDAFGRRCEHKIIAHVTYHLKLSPARRRRISERTQVMDGHSEEGWTCQRVLYPVSRYNTPSLSSPIMLTGALLSLAQSQDGGFHKSQHFSTRSVHRVNDGATLRQISFAV